MPAPPCPPVPAQERYPDPYQHLVACVLCSRTTGGSAVRQAIRLFLELHPTPSAALAAQSNRWGRSAAAAGWLAGAGLGRLGFTSSARRQAWQPSSRCCAWAARATPPAPAPCNARSRLAPPPPQPAGGDAPAGPARHAAGRGQGHRPRFPGHRLAGPLRVQARAPGGPTACGRGWAAACVYCRLAAECPSSGMVRVARQDRCMLCLTCASSASYPLRANHPALPMLACLPRSAASLYQVGVQAARLLCKTADCSHSSLHVSLRCMQSK